MKPVLLLVDDNAEILDFIADELSEKYQVLLATNGQEALDKLKVEAVHLVVSDVMMDVMDGFELCKAIKTCIDLSHIPVILLTAKNTLQSKIEGLEIGADAYIEKPFSPEYLQVQIANLLANRNKVKEYFANSPLVHLKSMAYSKADEQFLEKLNEVIYSQIENIELDIEMIGRIMNLSRPTLYRKIKAISDLTPNELVNIARLKKAAELLVDGSYRINEVSDMVGFASQTNFGRSFHKQFGMSPSEYQKSKHIEGNS